MIVRKFIRNFTGETVEVQLTFRESGGFEYFSRKLRGELGGGGGVRCEIYDAERKNDGNA